MKLKIIIILFFYVELTFGQDIHFSQADLSPLNLNPALTGKFDADYRLHANERTQWRSVTTPYKTFSTSFDAYLQQLKFNGYFGAGIVFNTDKAGDGDFSTNQVKLCFAYHYKSKADTNLTVSGGFNFGYNQNSLNYSKLYFGNQYNGYNFDPTLPNNEVFANNNMHYFDGAIGFNVGYFIKNIPVEAGISYHHLNKPEQSFYNQAIVELDRKFDFHASAIIKVSDKTNILPTIFWFRQGILNEINIGGLAQQKLNSNVFKSIYLGGWLRWNDAGILCFAFDYQNFRIGLSYDVNISSLKVASASRGGLEISLRYIFNSYNSLKIPNKHICPPFI